MSSLRASRETARMPHRDPLMMRLVELPRELIRGTRPAELAGVDEEGPVRI